VCIEWVHSCFAAALLNIFSFIKKSVAIVSFGVSVDSVGQPDTPEVIHSGSVLVCAVFTVEKH